jgi:dystrophin
VLFFCRGRLESNAEQWTALLTTLRELIEWLAMKDEDLSQQQPVGGDLISVKKQNDDHKVGTELEELWSLQRKGDKKLSRFSVRELVLSNYHTFSTLFES